MLLLAVSVLFVNCSKDEDPAPAATTNNTPPSIAATWTRTVSGKTYAVTLNADLSYSATSNGTAFENGTYTNSGSAIVLNAAINCTGKPGSYSYTTSGNTITFTMTSDACTGRGTVIGGTWTK
jgi:hypothetical protein